MGAPVPIFSQDDWRRKPGAELAMNSAVSEQEFNDVFGLTLVAGEAGPDGKGNSKYVAPRAEMLRRGAISVEDLDDEELARGQVRDSDGRFRGRPQSRIPREFHAEIMRRILEKGVDKFRSSYINAIDVMLDIMNDVDEDSSLRFRAAQYVIERLAGKTPEQVEVKVDHAPWEVTLQSIIRSSPDQATIDAAGGPIDLPSFVDVTGDPDDDDDIEDVEEVE